MKQDEKDFFIQIYEHYLASKNCNFFFSARRFVDEYMAGNPQGTEKYIPIKRICFFFEKWNNKDYYNYGVNILAGWFTNKAKPIYDKFLLEAIEQHKTKE